MNDTLAQFWADLVGRLSGPFSFRFVLQPVMALIFAVRDGMKDAHQGKPPYFWAIFTHRGKRRQLLRDGWQAVFRIIILGTIMEVLYQLIVFRWIYPLELVVVVLLLAFIPYLVIRGPVNRFGRFRRSKNVKV